MYSLDSEAPASEARASVPAPIKPDAHEIKTRHPPTTTLVVAEDEDDNPLELLKCEVKCEVKYSPGSQNRGEMQQEPTPCIGYEGIYCAF